MNWNYRIVKTTEGEDVTYIIGEVYYNDKGEAVAYGAATPLSETVEGLKEVTMMMVMAFSKPALDDATDFTGKFREDGDDV